jgi:hypothetical protein
MERRRFTREFKLEAMRLIKERGVSFAQASHDLSVHQSQLRSWVNFAYPCRFERPVLRTAISGTKKVCYYMIVVL